MSGRRTNSFSAAILASLVVHGLVGVGMWYAPPLQADSASAAPWRNGHLVMLDQPPMAADAVAPEPPKAAPLPPVETPKPIEQPRVSAEPEPPSPPPEPKPPGVRVGDAKGSPNSNNPISSEAEGEHTARQGDQDQPGMSINSGPGGPPAPAVSGRATPAAPQPPAPSVEFAQQPTNVPDQAPIAPPSPEGTPTGKDGEAAKPEPQPDRPVEEADKPTDAKPVPSVGASTSPLAPTGKDDPRPTPPSPSESATDKPIPSEAPNPAPAPEQPKPLPVPVAPREPQPLPEVPDPSPDPKAMRTPAEPIDPNREVGERNQDAASPQKQPEGAGLAEAKLRPNVPEAAEVKPATREPMPEPAAPPPPSAAQRTPGAQDTVVREGATTDTLHPLTLDQRALDMVLAMSTPRLSPIAPLLIDRAAHAMAEAARPARPPAVAVAPSQPASRPGGGEPGAPGPKDSDAFSVRVTGEYRNGKVVGAEGLDIRTVRPQFTLLARTFSSPRVVVVEMAFLRSGQVRQARIVRSSGFDAEIDQPVLNAVYAWTATGKALTELPDDPEAHVLLTVAINLH